MSKKVHVDHPLFDRLLQVDKKATKQFPGPFDPGLGSLGLIFDEQLDQSRYAATPGNCVTFAWTGGEGVHFSFLATDNCVRENSPIVITIPEMGINLIVGENLFDFLCICVHRGFFALEQLAYKLELTLEVYMNPEWVASESWHDSVGFNLNEENKQLLEFLKNELALHPWSSVTHFHALQERYSKLLDEPSNEGT